MPPQRWEHGSEFHALFEAGGPTAQPWDGAALHCGSGRDALRAVLADGRDHRGLRRLWVPSYFCQEVVAALLKERLPIVLYRAGPEDLPDLASIPLAAGDAVLRVNLFGLQDLGPPGVRREGIEIIEDHTHDPWSRRAWSSDADFCVASLRKTVPVPDGGVLWSPLHRPLPPALPFSAGRRLASLEKLSAMLLKERYLRGDPVRKDLFRSLALEGEAGIGEGPPSSMAPWSRAILDSLPLDSWRARRARNHRALAAALCGLPGVRVLLPANPAATCPFLLALVFEDPARRDPVRADLAEGGIYAGAHWPLDAPAIDGIPPDHLDLGRRILTLHCDFRYGPEDLDMVAAEVRKAVLARPAKPAATRFSLPERGGSKKR